MVYPGLRSLSAILIVSALSACDNVEWAGVDVSLVPPPPIAEMAAGDSVAPEAEVEAAPTLPTLPEGAVLYMGSRDGARVSLRPIAELTDGGMRGLESTQPGFFDYFAQQRMSAGQRFTLFAEGVRVGTVRADTVFTEPGFCSPTPVLEGIAEIVQGAGGAQRFVALPEDAAEDMSYGRYTAPNHTYEQRVASLNLAQTAISANGAIWPESVLEIRADIQAVPIDGDSDGMVAATFLYQDQMSVSPVRTASAYSLFVLGEGGPVNYAPTFAWYRPASDRGKGAPRLWEQADWDGDGESEVLLQVFGESVRWAAALDRVGGSWQVAFEESCGR